MVDFLEIPQADPVAPTITGIRKRLTLAGWGVKVLAKRLWWASWLFLGTISGFGWNLRPTVFSLRNCQSSAGDQVPTGSLLPTKGLLQGPRTTVCVETDPHEQVLSQSWKRPFKTQ